jgi:hypothetical protein
MARCPSRRVQIDRQQLLQAARDVGIDDDAAEALLAQLNGGAARHDARALLTDRPARFTEQSGLSRMIQVLVWLGVLLVIGAHAWWSTNGYEEFGFGLVLGLTLMWQLLFLAAAEWARRAGYTALTAGFAAIVAFYTPLSVYSLERLLGVGFDYRYEEFYPWISEGWVWMEVTAIAVAVALIYRYRHPFLALPITIFVGFLAMALGARVFGLDLDSNGHGVEKLVLGVGVGMAAAGVLLDYRGLRRFALWPHIGSFWLIPWGFLELFDSESLPLFVVGGAAILAGVWLARIAHLAFGALAAWSAITLLAEGALFPFFLLAGGILFVVAAVWLARGDTPLQRWLADRGLPAPQRDLAY